MIPAYNWCCLSCGEVNAKGSIACLTCNCPAAASVSELVEHRKQFIASGGVLKPGATTLHEPPEVSATEIVGFTTAVLLGFLPLS